MSERLAELLGGPSPQGIAELPAEARTELIAVLAAARRQQAEELAAALEVTLRHVPFPLRPIVKRINGIAPLLSDEQLDGIRAAAGQFETAVAAGWLSRDSLDRLETR